MHKSACSCSTLSCNVVCHMPAGWHVPPCMLLPLLPCEAADTHRVSPGGYQETTRAASCCPAPLGPACSLHAPQPLMTTTTTTCTLTSMQTLPEEPPRPVCSLLVCVPLTTTCKVREVLLYAGPGPDWLCTKSLTATHHCWCCSALICWLLNVSPLVCCALVCYELSPSSQPVSKGCLSCRSCRAFRHCLCCPTPCLQHCKATQLSVTFEVCTRQLCSRLWWHAVQAAEARP